LASANPERRLSAADVAVFVLGIVVGVGIFRAPAEVAANAPSDAMFLALWGLGGVAALAGALCYAELAARHPGIGGEYGFLRRAWGEPVGVLFIWARTAVIQTGSIAAVAFVLGDYAIRLLPDASPALVAGLAVLAFTLLNLLGVDLARRAQWLLLSLVLVAILGVVAAGGVADPLPPPAATPSSAGSLGLALVFVMLTFGGWNEAAYLSGETRDGTRGFVRGLVGGILVVALVYLAVNLAYLAVLGREGLALSAAPAADLAAAAFGPFGETFITAAILLAALSTLNVTILTGGRAMCALGQAVPAFAFLGRWETGRSVPGPALLIQGAVSLLLIAYGAGARDSFGAMVAFGAPVFWLFLLLTILALFRFRARAPGHRGFRVPLWPVTPLLFAAVCGWMLWSSIGYARFLAGTAEGASLAGWLGIGVLAAGVPLLWLAGRRAGVRPAE
jgi:APA family basic amino acid/polyamine antiporter